MDILDYYELTVPEGEFTPEEMEEFGDLDDDDDLNIGRGIGAGCGNFCRITIKNQKQKWIKPPNCKRVAKSKWLFECNKKNVSAGVDAVN